MPILSSVISRGTTILAEYTSTVGNFNEVTVQILENISPEDKMLTLSHGNFLTHYILKNGIIYMCTTDDEFRRTRAFIFLQDLQKKFLASYGSRAESVYPFAINSEFAPQMKILMNYYSEAKDVETITRVHGELDELQNIMVKNIENITMRGEKVELLLDKTADLSKSATNFRMNSRNLQRSLFLKNLKLYIIIGAVVIVILYFIVAMFCGLSLSQCF